MRSVTHFLRYSSLKCSKQTFTVRSVIMNSFTSSPLSSEVNGELKKLSLFCGRFQSLLVAFRNSKTHRHSEIKQTRLFRGSIVKTKHRGLTSLTFMQLVPGDDRVIRHICIRCILPTPCSQCCSSGMDSGDTS